MNNSIHLNLLRFELLSRESETEHHAACSAVRSWSIGQHSASSQEHLWHRKFTRQVLFKCQLTLLGDVR